MEKYITKDEYLIAKGIDLDLELKNNDNASKKAERFIKEVTDWCLDYLLLNYGANELNEWNDLAEWRQERFRKGVIEQICYIIDNGYIAKDSGINRTTGTILNLENLILDKNAFLQFRLGAYCNVY